MNNFETVVDELVVLKDIPVIYVTATSFPAGIEAAMEKLHSTIPFSPNRKYFGISRPESGGDIVYRAAAEELESGEAEKYNLEKLILPKGKYIHITLHNYRKNLGEIPAAFERSLQHENLDPQGYCVEWYTDVDTVKCMIRLRS